MIELLATNPVWDAYRTSDLFGKGIFLALLILSIVTWSFFIQRWRMQRFAFQSRDSWKQALPKIRQHPLQMDLVSPGPFAMVYKNLKNSSLELLHKNRASLPPETPVVLSHTDMDNLSLQLQSAISEESKKLDKNLFILSTIVSLAPFLGLLGTVWGILLTFNELQHGANVNANATIMGGLAMALGTTVVGLVVAIPALISYNVLKSSAAELETEMEDFSQHILAAVELHYRKVDIV